MLIVPFSSREPPKNVGFLFTTPAHQQNGTHAGAVLLVGRGGFEPPKSLTSDLQSDPFGRSGTYPYMKLCVSSDGAGDGN